MLLCYAILRRLGDHLCQAVLSDSRIEGVEELKASCTMPVLSSGSSKDTSDAKTEAHSTKEARKAAFVVSALLKSPRPESCMCSSAKSKVFGGIPSALPKIEFRISFFNSR